jgi:hypothetical protein
LINDEEGERLMIGRLTNRLEELIASNELLQTTVIVILYIMLWIFLTLYLISSKVNGWLDGKDDRLKQEVLKGFGGD